MARGPKPALTRTPPTGRGWSAKAERTVHFRDMEDDSVYISLSKLNEPHQAGTPGECFRCERSYRAGEWVFRDTEGNTVAVNCCGTTDDMRTESVGADLKDAEDIDGRDWVPLAQVLPTGKTKADMCPKCFQIPASNGICGCS